MRKRIFSLILALIMVISVGSSFAASSATDYQSSLAKLKTYGIIDTADLNLNGNMSRGVFAKLIVNSTGNTDLAKSLSVSSMFSDVSVKSELCGYINASVSLGYLSALSDGKFKPNENITYAQVCTALVKALGYGYNDIVGSWPKGFIDKAKSLGITTGFSLSSSNAVTTKQSLIMIDRLLSTNVKKNNAADADKTLAESSGVTSDSSNWVYSKPEVAMNFNASTKKLGNIKFDSVTPFLRNTTNNSSTPATTTVGENISISDIKDKDVVYQVYNKMEVLMYYLVVDNKVQGAITSILPNKYSPETIEINNVSYQLGDYANLDKFNTSANAFKVGDSVTAVLGYDGKIVDAFYSDDSNCDEYAFVVNTQTTISTDAADYGKVKYTVDLLKVDGTQKTYITESEPNSYKWTLIKFSELTSEKVALMRIGGITPTDIYIDKDQRKFGYGYVTDNVKVYNYTDSTVNLVNWNDLPDGKIPAGKIKYYVTTGVFDDVCVIVTYDIFNQQNKDCVVQSIQTPDGKKVSKYTYSLMSGGNKYTYTDEKEIIGATVGSVLNMKTYNNNVTTFNQIKNPDALAYTVQAMDTKRIKLNGIVYSMNSDVKVYFKDYSGTLSSKSLSDIEVGKAYSSIKLYCDRPLDNNGKVSMIVVNLT